MNQVKATKLQKEFDKFCNVVSNLGFEFVNVRGGIELHYSDESPNNPRSYVRCKFDKLDEYNRSTKKAGRSS
jgi:hypothetical protein